VSTERTYDYEPGREPTPGAAVAPVAAPTVAVPNTLVARVLAPGGGARSALPDDVAAGIAAEQGGGSTLPGPVRDEMGAAFGADFSGVRLHSDPRAAQLSRSVGAEAFTSGRDIYLADPAGGRDRELLAHELTHVVQQTAAPAGGGPTRVSDPAEPAEAEARHIARAVTGLGPIAGNQAVVRRLGGGALQRSPTSDATTIDQVKEIRSFEGTDDNEKLRLMNILLDQIWVGSSDEAALERIWNSFSEEGMVRFCDAHPDKFSECFNRGADLLDSVPYKAITNHFSTDIAELAKHYLGVNEKVVQQELDAVGSGAPPGPQQTDRIAELQEAATVLADLQRAQEAAKMVAVGWRVGDGGDVDPEWTGRQVKYEALFKPGEPPPLTAEPQDIPPGDLFLHRKAAYADVQSGYDAVAQSITHLVEAYPALYGMVRDGNSTRTADFVTTADPAAAREKMSAPLRKALTDIATTRTNLGHDLDPLDLQPLVDQLFAGGAAVGGTSWTGGFRQHAARNALVGHSIDKAFKRAITQEIQVLALALAPLTSGASLLLLLAASATAAGVQAFGSYKEAKVVGAAEGSSVKPGTELVPPGTAEHARIAAEADLIAFGLALLALGAEGIASWRAGRPEPRIRISHGTDQGGYQGVGGLDGGLIDVTHSPGGHQDLGQGFYATLETETASVYGFRRGAQRGGGMQHVLTWEVPRKDLGVIADIRPGGNLRAQWEVYLKEPPPFPGGFTPPGFETNQGLLKMAPEQRGVVFERFLTRNGMQAADTIMAPLGDEIFTGIGSSRGTSTQVCIRSQRVADRLNEQMRTGR